jgi:choline-sulfatase
VLGALDELGLTEATRVLYTSDHGDAVGHHALVGKCTLYESSMAVPLIMAGPGVPAGRVIEPACSHVDLFPTILEAFGVPLADADRDLPGTSLWPAMRGESRPRPIFGEYHGSGSRVASYMLRDGADKLIYHAGFQAQLFDLAADPFELHDLAAAEPARVAALEAALREILDPEAVDARAKADQRAMAERVGGTEAIRARGAFPFTPAPGTDARIVEVS